MRGVRVVRERQGHRGEFLSDSLNEDAEGKGIAYPASPFIDGVHGGGSNDYSVSRQKDIRFSWFFVGAAHRMPGLLFQSCRVYESHCRGCCEQADVPSVTLGRFNKPCDLPGGRSSAGNNIKHVGHAVTPERSASDWSDAGTLPRERSIRFAIVLRATGRQFTSRGARASASRSFPRASSLFPHWL